MSNEADLAYLREIAESGQKAASLGGRFFLWWGVLATIALLAHWAILAGVIGSDPSQVGMVWLAYGVIGGIGSSFLGRGLARKPGTGSVSNRAERAVWNGAGLTIFAYVIGTVAANLTGNSEVIIYDTIPLMAFAGYGTAFWATSSMGGPGWQRFLALGSWAMVIAGAFFVGKPELYLLCAGGVFLLSVLPGLVLIRQEPATEQ